MNYKADRIQTTRYPCYRRVSLLLPLDRPSFRSHIRPCILGRTLPHILRFGSLPVGALGLPTFPRLPEVRLHPLRQPRRRKPHHTPPGFPRPSSFGRTRVQGKERWWQPEAIPFASYSPPVPSFYTTDSPRMEQETTNRLVQ